MHSIILEKKCVSQNKQKRFNAINENAGQERNKKISTSNVKGSNVIFFRPFIPAQLDTSDTVGAEQKKTPKVRKQQRQQNENR